MGSHKGLRTLAGVLLVGLLAACGTTQPSGAPAPAPAAGGENKAAAPAQPVKLRLGVMAVSDCIQAFIADDQGFFKDQGLQVELQTMKGGAEIAPAVAGGSLDAGWSNMVSIALAHDKGLDFVYIAPGVLEKAGNHEHRIVVAANSPIQSLKELEGKTVATNTLDNTPYVAFANALKGAGVDPQKVQFVEIPFPNMIAALKEGKVQATILPEPFVTAGLANGSIRIIDDKPFETFGPRAFIASWFTSDKWVKSNADTAKRFVAAIRKANEFLASHPTEARKIMLKYTKLDESIASKLVLGAYEDQVLPSDLQPVIDSAVALGLLKKGFPASEILRI